MTAMPVSTKDTEPEAAAAVQAAGTGAAQGSVVLTGVTKHYGDFVALDDFSLSVAPGEFLSILGPSGSGKTTTMRIIGGFVEPTAGTVLISGTDMSGVPPHRRDVNTVFQNYALFPHLTVEDNVGYGLRMKGVRKAQRRRRANEMLELVQLTGAASKRPGQLSGGMQQRVALARALAAEPAVLLLDEPLGALDRKLRADMQVELRRLQNALGTTFIYVTHDQEEALGMSDRIVVMRDGRIVQIGDPATVYDDPASLWLAGFVGSSNQLRGTLRSGASGPELETDRTTVAAAHVHGEAVAGQPCVAVIRPELLRLVSESGHRAVNSLVAEVTEVLTLGSELRVRARTPSGTELTIVRLRGEAQASPTQTSQAQRSEALRPGARTCVQWEADAVHLYPEP
jgi:spermidine/putrescine ABC transporter ATP-binding subunit